MKKTSKLTKAAAALAVLALGTSCFVGGTFAKYTTSGGGKDTARVAKFGVTVTASDNSMFKKNYETTDTSKYAGKYSVSSSTDDYVVAPGTDGNMASVNITGTPEVAVEVKYEGALELGTDDDWTITTDEEKKTTEVYCPLVFTVDGTDYYIGGKDSEGTTITDITSLEKAVSDAVGAATDTYDPNTDLSGTSDKVPTVSWRWYFTANSDGNPLASYQTDVKDTLLGDKAVGGDIGIEFDLDVTVTQID